MDGMQPNGEDLRFVDENCTRVLPHEIESFDRDSISLIWVAVPLIDAGDATEHFWMYHGNTDAPDIQDGAAVFGSGFVGVFHLHDDLEDSSPSGNHGVNAGSTSGAGPVANGRLFDFDLAQEIAIGDADLPMGTSPRSICGWAATSALDSNPKHWFISYGTFETRGGFFIGRVGDELWCGGIGDDIKAPGIYVLDQWAYHCCVVEAGGQVKLYSDGQLVMGPQSHSWVLNPGEALIGGHVRTGLSEAWDGGVDEVRISSEARTSEWIQAEYYSMTDQLLTVEATETLP